MKAGVVGHCVYPVASMANRHPAVCIAQFFGDAGSEPAPKYLEPDFQLVQTGITQLIVAYRGGGAMPGLRGALGGGAAPCCRRWLGANPSSGLPVAEASSCGVGSKCPPGPSALVLGATRKPQGPEPVISLLSGGLGASASHSRSQPHLPPPQPVPASFPPHGRPAP